MSNTVIKVENISKLYRLGAVGTGTLSHDLNRMWARVRGKEDPFAKLGEVNNRAEKGSSDFVWSLRDINFDVKQGEVLGIIGRNGAGKSTLLKILSRTTSPTTGNIKIKGRVASLLEVGTGFHPELSGRENIYLNGSILGMTKGEITRKFDEIVDFSGVERYIDTPVKRYSSGMYVRLAFAVAANMEPDILIVDEVLAVGDAEFQKKCLGKMKDVSVNQGRTVLFVSHNMGAIKQLCTSGLLMEKGTVAYRGDIKNIIEKYFVDEFKEEYSGKRDVDVIKNEIGYFFEWGIENGIGQFSNYTREIFNFKIKYESLRPIENVELGFVIRDFSGEIIYGCNNRDNGGDYLKLEKGTYCFNFNVRLPLRHGNYEIDLTIVSDKVVVDQWVAVTKLTVVSKFESVLPDVWTGILQELPTFSYENIS